MASTYYIRTDGSDSNDGSADDAAHAFLTIGKGTSVATSGDTINVAAGTFDLVAGAVNVPAGVILQGAGIAATIVQSTRIVTTGTILHGENNATINDLAIVVKTEDPVNAQAPVGARGFGSSQSFSTGVTINRCNFVGFSDAIYFQSGSGASWTFNDCTASSTWDTMRCQAGITLTFNRCTFAPAGPSSQAGSQTSRAVSASSGTITLNACRMIPTGGEAGNYGVHVDGGTVVMTGANSISTPGGASDYDLIATTGSIDAGGLRVASAAKVSDAGGLITNYLIGPASNFPAIALSLGLL